MIGNEESVKEKLRSFLEIYNKTKIISIDPGQLRMQLQLAITKNTKIKEKMIAFLLNRLDERLFSLHEAGGHAEKDLCVCEFLIDECMKFVSSGSKKSSPFQT